MKLRSERDLYNETMEDYNSVCRRLKMFQEAEKKDSSNTTHVDILLLKKKQLEVKLRAARLQGRTK